MMTRSWLWAALGALALAPTSAARAQQPGTGFEAGLRSGYALALGEATGEVDDDLNESIAGAVPLWLDVGYRVLPELFVGAYGHYAFAFLGGRVDEACDNPAVDCSASDVRIGLQAHYHPAPKSVANPWVGLGFGYEWLSFGAEGDDDTETSVTVHGFEFANLQVGLDFEVSQHFHLGPMLSFSLGQYANMSSECTAAADACDGFPAGEIQETALHEWLTLGVRAAYAP